MLQRQWAGCDWRGVQIWHQLLEQPSLEIRPHKVTGTRSRYLVPIFYLVFQIRIGAISHHVNITTRSALFIKDGSAWILPVFLDSVSGEWTQLCHLSVPRRHHSALILGKSPYAKIVNKQSCGYGSGWTWIHTYVFDVFKWESMFFYNILPVAKWLASKILSHEIMNNKIVYDSINKNIFVFVLKILEIWVRMTLTWIRKLCKNWYNPNFRVLHFDVHIYYI